MKNEKISILLLLFLSMVSFQVLNTCFHTETEITVHHITNYPSRSLTSIAKPRADAQHNPITIDGNTDFNAQAIAEGWDMSGTRDGTKEYPYLISGLNISNFSGDLISISNSDVYFHIANCILMGGTGRGISCSYVKNGLIINNTISNNYGISLQYSTNNTVGNNTISNNNGNGIRLHISTKNTITNNTVSNNDERGISIWSSSNNTIVNNFISDNNDDGIRLVTSRNNIIIGNNLTNNGLVITGNTVEDFLQSEVADNLVDGKPLVYWKNIIGGLVPLGVRQIFLINVSKVTISGQNLSSASVGLVVAFSKQLNINNNIISNNGDGIYLHYSQNNSIINNTLSYNDEKGISLGASSKKNTIANNTISNNGLIGIYLNTYSTENTIANNTISNNGDIGIHLDTSTNNTILFNNMTNDGLYIDGNVVKDYIQSEVVGNLVNGKPLLYWKNIIGGLVPLGAGQVVLVNTSTVTIKSQNLSNSSVGLVAAFSQQLNINKNIINNNSDNGISLSYSTNNSIVSNTINNNNDDGIYLGYSTNNIIANNTISNSNDDGIDLDYSKNNVIANNTISDNTDDGIYLWVSANNTIVNNTISNNNDDGVYSGFSTRKTQLLKRDHHD